MNHSHTNWFSASVESMWLVLIIINTSAYLVAQPNVAQRSGTIEQINCELIQRRFLLQELAQIAVQQIAAHLLFHHFHTVPRHRELMSGGQRNNATNTSLSIYLYLVVRMPATLAGLAWLDGWPGWGGRRNRPRCNEHRMMHKKHKQHTQTTQSSTVMLYADVDVAAGTTMLLDDDRLHTAAAWIRCTCVYCCCCCC